MSRFILSYLLLIFSTQVSGEVLTFEQAMSTAKQENLNLQMAEGKYMQAHAVVFKTISNYLPKISITGNYTRNSHESKFTMPSAPDERPKKITLQPLDSLGLQAQLNQLLISPWYIAQMINLGKYSESIKLNREQSKQDIFFGVAQLYYAASASKEALNIQEKLVLSKIAHTNDMNLRLEQGLVIKADLLRAQVELVKSKQDLSMAKNTHQADKLALATMLNRRDNFEITTPPPIQKPELSQPINRLDLKAAFYEAELAQSSKINSYLKYLPDLSMFLQYKATNSVGLAGDKHTFAAGLNLTWNIFDGGLREAEIYDNHGKDLQAKAGARLRESNINQEFEVAKLNLTNAESNLVLADKQIELSREHLRLIQINYNEGLATYQELSDVSNNLAAAEMSLVACNLSVNLAILKLKQVMGIFE